MKRQKKQLADKISDYIHKIAGDKDYRDELITKAISILAPEYSKRNSWKEYLKKIISSDNDHEMTPVERFEYAYINYLANVKSGVTLHKLTMLYGMTQGTEKFNEYCRLQSETNKFEYKQQKYGMTKEEFDSYNASRSVTLANMIERHGELIGTEKFNEYVERQRYAGCKLEYFIETYGELKGREEYDRISKLKARTLESYILKYGDEGYNKWCEYTDKMSSNNFYSNKSATLFAAIDSELQLPRTFYSPKTHEFNISDKELERRLYYDFTIKDYKIIIEFNGDIYHASPLKYSESDIPRFRGNKKTAAEIWKSDFDKVNSAISRGYDVTVVWEHEFDFDFDNTVRRLVEYVRSKIAKSHPDS